MKIDGLCSCSHKLLPRFQLGQREGKQVPNKSNICFELDAATNATNFIQKSPKSKSESSFQLPKFPAQQNAIREHFQKSLNGAFPAENDREEFTAEKGVCMQEGTSQTRSVASLI